jgi:hypothetical protein
MAFGRRIRHESFGWEITFLRPVSSIFWLVFFTVYLL